MNLYEYQAKRLLAGHGIASPPGAVAYTPEEARRVAGELGAQRWMVKAQILAGDRQSAGGVRLADSPAEVARAASELLGQRLVTAQTGPSGETVRSVYVEQTVLARSSCYLGALVDRRSARTTLLAARDGGSGFERRARGGAKEIRRVAIDPDRGPQPEALRALAADAAGETTLAEALPGVMTSLYETFTRLDASLIELNPLVCTPAGDVLCLDAKMSIDDNALFRHPDLASLGGDDESERRSRTRHGFNYLKLQGDIGCLVNGAGLAMATMDMIAQRDAVPANFLDLPPAATREQIMEAFRLVLKDPAVKAVLVNIIGGGITRCDAVAESMAMAVRALQRRVPLVVRFEGVNRDLGYKTLRDVGIAFARADDLETAVEQAVNAARRSR